MRAYNQGIRSDMTIYHLVQKDVWGMYQKDGFYTPPSFEREGFIHCSTKEQVLATANRRFAGINNLLLLIIDTEKIPANIKFEDLRGAGEKHPHVYGTLPLSAVQEVRPIFPNHDGVFTEAPTIND